MTESYISQINFADTNHFLSPNGLFDKVFDDKGNQYKLRDLNVKNEHVNFSTPNQNSNQNQLIVFPNCNSGYFNLFFEDGSGFELNNVLHQQRRDVICQVFQDLSNFITSPLSNTGLKVNILIRDVSLINTNPNLTGTASAFYVAPQNVNPNVGGIIDNQIWKMINSGINSYEGVVNPIAVLNEGNVSNNLYHGWMAFNFSPQTFQWHYDLNTVAPNYNMDLYTVVLHEILHAIGITSLISENGTSRLGNDFPYYSRYDRFLSTNNLLEPLISNTGNCSMYNYTFNPNLDPNLILSPSCTNNLPDYPEDHTNCPSTIKFEGSVEIPVYTPACFETGSSLSHFEDQCFPLIEQTNNNKYFALTESYNPLIVDNNTKRFLQEEERMVLCDLGYSVNTTFGDVSGNIVVNNYKLYNQVCSNNTVVGVIDGISTNGSYNITLTSNILNSSQFLANDYSNNLDPIIGFECFSEVTIPVNGGTIISTTFGNNNSDINIQMEGGLHVFSYIPISQAGTRGNITYIYIFGEYPQCPNSSSCDLVYNGNFEDLDYCGSLPMVNSAAWGTIPPCWAYWNNSPDMFSTNCTSDYFTINENLWYSTAPTGTYNGQIDNNNFFGFATVNSVESPYYETVMNRLNSQLVPGQEYVLSFWAKTVPDIEATAINLMPFIPYNPTSPIALEILSLPTYGENPLPFDVSDLPMSNYFPAAINLLPLVNIELDNQWHYYTENFTFEIPNGYLFSQNHGKILLSSHSFPTQEDEITYVVFDDVSILPIAPTLNLPEVVCEGEILNDLTDFLSFDYPNAVFSGIGVVNTNGVYSFNSSVVGSGDVVTVSYTYSDNNSCENTIFDDIIVNLNVISSLNEICEGESVLIFPNGNSVFTLNPGNMTSNGEAFEVNPISTTIYTITSLSNQGCNSASQDITITVNPLPNVTFIITPSETYFCNNTLLSFQPSGALSYQWTTTINGIIDDDSFLPYSSLSNVTSTLNQTTTYNLIGLGENNCTNTFSTTKELLSSANPTISITTPTITICPNQNTTFTATTTNTGTNQTYQWKINGTNVVGETAATFSSTTLLNNDVITCELTADNPCATTNVVLSNGLTMSVTNGPTLDLMVSDASICAGNSSTLSVSGANTYLWSTNETTDQITVSPTTTTTYTVTGTDINGCMGDGTTTITVAPLTVSITASALTVCSGNNVTLTASGAGVTGTYEWTNITSNQNLGNVNPLVVNLTSTTEFSVLGTDENACTNTFNITINTIAVVITITPTPDDNNICVGESVTLTASGATTYSWSNGLGAGAVKTVSPTSTTTYTVTGTIGSCTVQQSETITVENCLCSPLSANVYYNNALISSPVTHTNKIFFVEGTLKISANATFTNCEFRMTENSRIEVTHELTIFRGCHLYSCSNKMWEGIEVLEKGRLILNAQIPNNAIIKTTLIEDARIAVYVHDIINVDNVNKVLKINNTTINKNRIGVKIKNFTIYDPFAQIEFASSAIICRDIPFVPATLNNVATFIWPLTSDIIASNGTADVLDAPYINSNTYSKTNPASKLKGSTDQITYKGIELINVGSTSGDFENLVFDRVIQVGVNYQSKNVFDNLEYGIYADNTNLRIKNTIFQNINSKSFGIGIYTQSLEDSPIGQRNLLDLDEGLPNNNTKNKFYNCNFAVNCNQYAVIRIKNIEVKHPTNFSNERHGIIIKSSFIKNINITNSMFYNLFSAVHITNDNPIINGNYENGKIFVTTQNYSIICGEINVTENQFYDNALTNNEPGKVMKEAIKINSVLNTNAYNIYYLFDTKIKVNKNTIVDAYRGIALSNWRNKHLAIKLNNINLVSEQFLEVKQYGILNANNTGVSSRNLIENNTIVGFSSNFNSNQSAINSELSSNQQISCNNVSNSYHGIYFAGKNLNTIFEENKMYKHTYGYTLDFDGNIGDQGFLNGLAHHYTANVWNGGWAAPSSYKTATLNGSNALNSRLVVKDIPLQNPNLNGYSDFLFGSTLYSNPNSILYNNTTPNSIVCSNNPDLPDDPIGDDDASELKLKEELEKIARNEIVYSYEPVKTKIINEHKVYQILKQNPIIMETSIDLTTFYDVNLNTNKDKIATTGAYINQGEINLANTEKESIISDNLVDESTKLFLDLYMLQTSDSLTQMQDSMVLFDVANSCPFKHGVVVYQARALYQAKYNFSNAFNDNCDMISPSFRKINDVLEKEINENSNRFMIYPNPNDGNFKIIDFNNETKDINVTIYDYTGKTVFIKEYLSNGNDYDLNLTLADGMYQIVIINKFSNEKYFQKISISK
jgi:hypothetical protein